MKDSSEVGSGQNSYAIPFDLLVYDEISFKWRIKSSMKKMGRISCPSKLPLNNHLLFFHCSTCEQGMSDGSESPTNRKIHQTFSGTEKNRGIPSPTKAGCVDTAYVRETTPLEQPAVRYRKPSIFLVLALPETYMKSRPETSMVWKMIHVLKFWGKKGPIFGTSDLFFSGVYL